MILIITNKEDVHPNPVIEILRQRNIPLFRLNTEALVTDYELSWYSDKMGEYFVITNTVIGLTLHSRDITAVWERRQEVPVAESGNSASKHIAKHNAQEAIEFLSYFLHFLGLTTNRIIGNHFYEKGASSKLYQLHIARMLADEYSIKIPNTIFSNSQSDILKFSKHKESLIIKSLDGSGFIDEDTLQEYTFYGTKIKPDDLSRLPVKAFNQTINFIEDYIEKDFELRITCVDKQIFACKLNSRDLPADKGGVDWRQGIENGIQYEKFCLPDPISTFCLKYLETMSLHFACFDFIVTPEGDYVFLECNPNGQWLWIEEETGLPISKAIADYLTGELPA